MMINVTITVTLMQGHQQGEDRRGLVGAGNHSHLGLGGGCKGEYEYTNKFGGGVKMAVREGAELASPHD